MDWAEIADKIEKLGVPLVILIWVLFLSGQNQKEMIKQMKGIQDNLANLTMCTHDVVTYIKAKGGDFNDYFSKTNPKKIPDNPGGSGAGNNPRTARDLHSGN